MCERRVATVVVVFVITSHLNLSDMETTCESRDSVSSAHQINCNSLALLFFLGRLAAVHRYQMLVSSPSDWHGDGDFSRRRPPMATQPNTLRMMESFTTGSVEGKSRRGLVRSSSLTSVLNSN